MEKLKPERATIFHNIVAKMLLVMKRSRPDTSTIDFLTMSVREPNIDDWRKLKHLIEYLQATSEMPLILVVDKSSTLDL